MITRVLYTLALVLFPLAICVGIFFFIHVIRIFSYGRKVRKFFQEHSGGKLVAKVLKSHGVQNIYTLSGGHISPILVASKKLGIKIVDCRDEKNAVFAADANSRLTGRIGVACVTAGPGVTNCITPLKNAQMAESSVLLIGGAAPSLAKNRGALQDVDQISCVGSICKMSKDIKRVNEIVPTLKEMIYTAKSGVCGPCFIEIPVDLLYRIKIVCDGLGIDRVAKSFFQKLVGLYMTFQVFSNFYKAFGTYDFTPLKVFDTKPSENQIKKAAKIINNGKRPIFLLGGQMVKNVKILDEIVTCMSENQIPFFVSGRARGLTGRKNPYCFYHRKRQCLKNADVIVMLGSYADFRLDYGRCFNKKAKIISVNLDKKKVSLNSPLFYSIAQKIIASPQHFIIQVSRFIRKIQRNEWMKVLKTLHESKINDMKKMEKVKVKNGFCNPLKLCEAINKYITKDTILLVDGGDFAATAANICRPRKYLQWMDTGSYGTLGCGAGFCLGAKICFPHKRVICFYGDGSFGWSISEFDTFYRFNIKNLIAVIGNDACWKQVEREQVDFYNDDVATKLNFTRYDKVVKAFGCEGFHIEKDENLERGMVSVFEMAKKNTVCLNVFIGETRFRKGSLSV